MILYLTQGGHEDMSSIFADHSASYMSPNAGGGGEMGGSQPMSTALINFGGLTPYLT